ncbi:hypothetical protein [Olleya aquimaris]|uniref:Uncharacterized protein n=1 Tax=Olleya aquimaris TaxID=639310 RepID=A0A327R5J8_9FLAO|nr:hypothetical protein [Olleya aquimaris]RAJ11881.1 hypothetical protein LY08_02590 [Olleya aquimaris]
MKTTVVLFALMVVSTLGFSQVDGDPIPGIDITIEQGGPKATAQITSLEQEYLDLKLAELQQEFRKKQKKLSLKTQDDIDKAYITFLEEKIKSATTPGGGAGKAVFKEMTITKKTDNARANIKPEPTKEVEENTIDD